MASRQFVRGTQICYGKRAPPPFLAARMDLTLNTLTRGAERRQGSGADRYTAVTTVSSTVGWRHPRRHTETVNSKITFDAESRMYNFTHPQSIITSVMDRYGPLLDRYSTVARPLRPLGTGEAQMLLVH